MRQHMAGSNVSNSWCSAALIPMPRMTGTAVCCVGVLRCSFRSCICRKSTPLAVAMLKGHLGIADFLLEQEGVDVNIKDDEGRTLVAQAVLDVSETTLVKLQYLVGKKKADVNVPDVS